MNTTSWTEIKDKVYGKKGTERRNQLDRDFEAFKIGLLLREAREKQNLTQSQLAELVDKKKTYISRIENNGSFLTLKNLFDIVEKGLGGKVNIHYQTTFTMWDATTEKPTSLKTYGLFPMVFPTTLTLLLMTR